MDELLALWDFARSALFSRLNSTFDAALLRARVSLRRVWIVELVKRHGVSSDLTRACLEAFFGKHGESLREESLGLRDVTSNDLDWTPWFSLAYCKVVGGVCAGPWPCCVWHAQSQHVHANGIVSCIRCAALGSVAVTSCDGRLLLLSQCRCASCRTMRRVCHGCWRLHLST